MLSCSTANKASPASYPLTVGTPWNTALSVNAEVPYAYGLSRKCMHDEGAQVTERAAIRR